MLYLKVHSILSRCYLSPLITEKTVSPFFAPISASKECGLVKNSLIDCLQIRFVALERVVKILGRVGDNTMLDVKQRLVKMLDIGEEHL